MSQDKVCLVIEKGLSLCEEEGRACHKAIGQVTSVPTQYNFFNISILQVSILQVSREISRKVTQINMTLYHRHKTDSKAENLGFGSLYTSRNKNKEAKRAGSILVFILHNKFQIS